MAADQNAAGSSVNDDLTPVLVAPAAASRFPSLVAHLMPFHITYDGPAPIDIFLVFDIEQSVTTPGKSVLTSAFRGRKLYGTPLELPANWSAAVVLKPTALEKEQALKVKERQLTRNRQAEIRAQKKSELSEVRRAEFEQRKEQRRAEREAAREAQRTEQIALRAEQQAARAAAIASGKVDPNADLGPEHADAENEDDDEEEDFDDENDLLEDLHFFEGALDDSADEYQPGGKSRAHDEDDEEDKDEIGRARKKPRPRPRPRASGPAAKSALSTGGLSAALSTTENPLGLPPPPQLESLSTLSRFQQAVAATAQQSFSMDDDDDEDADHDPVDEQAFDAGLDPTSLPAATGSDDMVLPADHQREQGDILDHSVVAIHASADVEMDALAIAAARAAHRDKTDEDEEAADGAYDDAEEEDAQEDNDNDDNGATGSTSAYFGRGGGSLVGGGLFDKIKARRETGAALSSRGSQQSQDTRSSPRRSDRGAQAGSASSTASPVSRTALRSAGGSQKPELAPERLGRLGRSRSRATPFEDDVIPGSDEEEEDSPNPSGKGKRGRSEDSASLSPPQRRSGRHNTEDTETRTSPRATRSSPRKHRSSSQSSPGKSSDKVVYGTGEAAAAARRAQEAEENRRKSSRKAPPPKRFVDDDIPGATTPKHKTTFAKAAKVKAEKDALKRSATSSSLAKNAAASGANAMKRWLSGAGSARASASTKISTPSPSKARRQAVAERADEDSEEEAPIGPSSRANRRQRDGEADVDGGEEEDGQGSEWEKESPKDRSRRLSAAPMEVVIKTANRKSLDSESSAGIWRRSESVSPKKAAATGSPSYSPSATRPVKLEHAVPKRIVTSVTSSGRVALRPTRYSLSPEPVPRKSHRKRLTRALPSEDEDEDEETGTDDSAELDEGDATAERRRGKQSSAGGPTVGAADTTFPAQQSGGVHARKRVWAKRWTFEERMDVMLGDSKSYSPLPVGSSAALQKAAKKRAAKEAALEGQVKLRVAGRLSTAAPPASTPSAALAADEVNEQKKAAWGTRGIVVWNADGEVDDGDDAVVRTVQELLGVWAMIHDY